MAQEAQDCGTSTCHVSSVSFSLKLSLSVYDINILRVQALYVLTVLRPGFV